MRNDLSVNIPCKNCGERSTNVVALDNDKGFECYCDKHKGSTGSDMDAIKKILNRR